jgi:polyhydroxyalkanoate synthesis regulator phasin
MELGDVPSDKEIVLKDEFDELRYRVQELEEELRKLKEYVEEATRLKQE